MVIRSNRETYYLFVLKHHSFRVFDQVMSFHKDLVIEFVRDINFAKEKLQEINDEFSCFT